MISINLCCAPPPLQNYPIWVLWAWHPHDPENGKTPPYHGANRGAKQLCILDSDCWPKPTLAHSGTSTAGPAPLLLLLPMLLLMHPIVDTHDEIASAFWSSIGLGSCKRQVADTAPSLLVLACLAARDVADSAVSLARRVALSLAPTQRPDRSVMGELAGAANSGT